MLKRIALGAAGATVLSLIFVAIGFIRALVVLLQGRSVAFDDVVAPLLWYVGGFAAAGALIGLLWPLTRIRPLRYVLGIVGAGCVVGAIVIAEEGAPSAWAADTVEGWLVLTVVFGLAAGLGIDRGVAAA